MDENSDENILNDPPSAKTCWFQPIAQAFEPITNADAIILPDPPSHKKNLSHKKNPLSTLGHVFTRFTKWLTGHRQTKREFKALNGSSRRWGTQVCLIQ